MSGPWHEALRRPTTPLWVLTLLAALGALWVGRSFFVALVASVSVAVLLWPLLRRVESVLRIRALAAVLVLGTAGALVAGGATLVSAQLAAVTSHAPDALRLAARDVGRLDSAGAVTVKRTRRALSELDRSVARVTGTPRALPESAAPAAPSGSLVAGVVEKSTVWLASMLRTGVEVALLVGVVAILSFFLLCTGDRLAHRLSSWVDGRPLARGRFSPLVSALAREIRAYGVVTIATNALIGLAVTLGFAWFDVADPWRWGLLAAALHFVPYAGMFVTMAVAAIEVYVQHEVWAVAALAAAYVGIVGLVVGSALATWMQGRLSRVDSAVMFGGTVFFATLWSGWGLVLGPLLVVSAGVLVAHARSALAPAAPPLPVTDAARVPT